MHAAVFVFHLIPTSFENEVVVPTSCTSSGPRNSPHVQGSTIKPNTSLFWPQLYRLQSVPAFHAYLHLLRLGLDGTLQDAELGRVAVDQVEVRLRRGVHAPDELLVELVGEDLD